MITKLKKILLKIALIPKKDQEWLLSQLSPAEKTQFQKAKGLELLEQALRFRNLAHEKCAPSLPPKRLPDFCEQLRLKDPLYLAIILEQTTGDWQQHFASSIIQEETISVQLKQLKPATKALIRQQWESTLDFSEQLECNHG